MMMLKHGIGLTAFAGAALLGASVTNAARINQVITTDGGGVVRFQDGSREDLYTGPGADGTFGTADDAVKEGTQIEEGDTIFGVLDVATVQRFPDGESGSNQSRLGVDTDNSELTAAFAIQAQSVQGNDGSSTIVFGADPDFGNGDGTVIRFYDDPNHNFAPDDGSRADGVDTAVDGDLALEIGFTGDEDEFFVTNGPSDISGLSDSITGQKVANSNFVLNRTTSNGLLGSVNFVERDSGGQFDGSSGIFGGSANSPFRIQNEANVSFTVIPTPTAGMAGVAMLGLMGLIRRRRRA